MSAFAKIAAASATGGGNNIRDGVYHFLIEKFVYQKGHNGECIIAEFRVKSAESNGAVVPAGEPNAGQPVIPNAVGSSCSMVCNLTKHESAAGNAKAFAIAAVQSRFGMSWGEFINADGEDGKLFPGGEEQVLAWLCSDEQPLRGVEVIDETYRFVNKGRSNSANAGKLMTANKWRAVDMTDEEVEANKKFLGSSVAKADVPVAPNPGKAATQTTTTTATAPQTTAPATTPPPAAKPNGALAGILKGKRS